MASKPVTLQIKPRGKRIPKLPTETSTYLQGSGSDLYQRIAQQSGFSIHRLRITKAEDGKPIPNDKKASIDSFGLRGGDTIQVKDLGPQIAWQTVFLIEYAGPLLIHPLIYSLRRSIYGPSAPTTPSTLQTLSCAMIIAHYLKRELETLFVHRFSNATMPVFNIFKNSSHYWILSGLLMAFFSYHPASTTAAEGTPALTYMGLALFVVGEVLNLNTHLVLRGLRSPGGTERGVPKGVGFGWVTCPNYLFESLAWTGFLLVNRNWTTVMFMVVAIGQMAVWAKKKEVRYRKEGAGRKKYCMIPGIW